MEELKVSDLIALAAAVDVAAEELAAAIAAFLAAAGNVDKAHRNVSAADPKRGGFGVGALKAQTGASTGFDAHPLERRHDLVKAALCMHRELARIIGERHPHASKRLVDGIK